MRILFISYKKIFIINITVFIILFAVMAVARLGATSAVLGVMGRNPIYKGDERQPRIAFECNVVWGTEYVPKMLDVFKEKGVAITFFIGGKWAQDNPELLKRIINEGHEVGNHGYNHKHHSKLSREENRKEIQRTEDIIYEITGIRTKLFAPPYGEFNKVTLQVADSLGYKTIMWSIDTIDWRRDGVDKIINRVLKKPHNGAFVLMHPTEDTVKALPYLIDQLRNKGYEIGKVSDLLK